MKKACKFLLLLIFLSVPQVFAQEKSGKKTAAPDVRIVTSLGNIEIALEPQRAPITVANFLYYVDNGYYNGTVFHRAIPKFMVQGGGYTEDMRPKQPDRRAIRNEADNGLQNLAGTVAMARTDNPDSATTQFFINLANNGHLDFKDRTRSGAGYAVFGKVTRGMNVVQKIAKSPTTTTGNFQDVPKKAVIIKSVERINKKLK